MDHSAIPSILKEINLTNDDVANIYHHGSWVYGTNSPTSDRDLIVVTRSLSQNPLKFNDDLNYLHEFELHRLWNQYDVCVYSVANFETLLKNSHMAVLQCVFLPEEFKLKEEIDFRTIYLEKYYNTLRLKQVAFYEMHRALDLYDTSDYSHHTSHSSRFLEANELQQNYVFKNLFHGLRILDFVEQLIQTRSIHDFKRVSYLFDQMKEIRGDPTDTSSMERVADFVRMKSTESKPKLDELIPTNTIKGSFEAYITFDCSHNTERVIEKLEETCENAKYKIIFIELDRHREKDKAQQQLMVSLHYDGEYPSIVKQVKEEVYRDFKSFHIIRIKIKVLASTNGVPESDMDKTLFWDQTTNYFEFRFKIEVRKNRKQADLRSIENICRRHSKYNLRLSHNAFQRIHRTRLPYVITMRLSDAGRERTLKYSRNVLDYLTSYNFAPSKFVGEFIVYDTDIGLDKD